MANNQIDSLSINDFQFRNTWKTEIRTTTAVEIDTNKTSTIIKSERHYVNTTNGRRFAFIKKHDPSKPLPTYEQDISSLRESFGTGLIVSPIIETLLLVTLVFQSLVLILKHIGGDTEQPTEQPVPFRARLLNIGKDVLRVVAIPITVFTHMLCIVYGLFKPLDAVNFCCSLLSIYETGVDREAGNKLEWNFGDMKLVTDLSTDQLKNDTYIVSKSGDAQKIVKHKTETTEENILPAT